MSRYTIELRHLIAAGYVPSLTDYPIFDAAYRAGLNAKIINHYYFYEIGQETADRFDHYLKTTMHEIMPYFNKLYQSETLIVNPLYTFDQTETTNRQSTGTTIGSTSSTDKSLNTQDKGEVKSLLADSDTPQGNLNIFDVEAGGYANKITNSKQSAVRDVSNLENTSDTTSAGEGANTEDFVRRVTGFAGVSAADLLTAYRSTLINIDMQVIAALKDLFMGVW